MKFVSTFLLCIKRGVDYSICNHKPHHNNALQYISFHIESDNKNLLQYTKVCGAMATGYRSNISELNKFKVKLIKHSIRRHDAWWNCNVEIANFSTVRYIEVCMQIPRYKMVIKNWMTVCTLYSVHLCGYRVIWGENFCCCVCCTSIKNYVICKCNFLLKTLDA